MEDLFVCAFVPNTVSPRRRWDDNEHDSDYDSVNDCDSATMAKMEVIITTVAIATKSIKWTTDLHYQYDDDSSREGTRYK
mmetsp:Transcript_41884/g.48341  ORF Transcript_41884/g.48341 Transcript_41884/m.48341 type:complete len:80 (+) Transcript_41884:166-405(+)